MLVLLRIVTKMSAFKSRIQKNNYFSLVFNELSLLIDDAIMRYF